MADTLFDVDPVPRGPQSRSLPHNGTPTSAAAAARAAGHADHDRGRILAWLRERGKTGATDDEMQVALDMSGNTQRPRRGELVEDRLVVAAVDGDKKRTRPTRSGGPAQVWIAVSNPES